jgi:hypothetical protein
MISYFHIMALVNIPIPCTEDFSKMTAAEKGFHCASCQKVVVDFRNKSDQEISDFIHENRGQNTCGRFKVSQVVRQRSFGFQIIRFAAALLLVFGSMLFTGCFQDEPEVMGDICVDPQSQHDYELMMARMKRDSTRLADSIASADSTK